MGLGIKKTSLTILGLILLSASLVSCGPGNNEVDTPGEKEILISAAASLTDVMEELAVLYQNDNQQTKILFTFGSSGALQAQIEEGAPVDIFMSAAQKQMETLQQAGLMEDDTVRTLLINKVVLIVPKGALLISSFEDLKADDIQRIAIGDPGNVPVGQYSQEIFQNLNMEDMIKHKLIFANDVRTVLTWVENDEVDCGLVYATDAYTSDRVDIVTEAPAGSHKEVTYPVGVVKGSKEGSEAKRFLEFLNTSTAISIFEKYGFAMN